MSAPEPVRAGAGDGRPGAALRRIGLVVHPRRRLDAALEALSRWAGERETDLVQIRIPGHERVVAEPGVAAECDLVVALGGDGTVLAALHAAEATKVPVLGIACGSLGALAAVDVDDLEGSLDRVADGRWTPRRLPALTHGDRDEGPFALNDLVITRAGAGQISIGIRVGGESYVRFGGDGLIVSTAIGSSAYTLAAGGPLVLPDTAGMVLTPLAPHGGTCPPLVVGTGTVADVLVEPGYGGARLEVDGQAAGLVASLSPRELHVRTVPDHGTLVAFGGQETMLAGLRRRGIIADSPRLVARDARAAAGGPVD